MRSGAQGIKYPLSVAARLRRDEPLGALHRGSRAPVAHDRADIDYVFAEQDDGLPHRRHRSVTGRSCPRVSEGHVDVQEPAPRDHDRPPKRGGAAEVSARRARGRPAAASCPRRPRPRQRAAQSRVRLPRCRWGRCGRPLAVPAGTLAAVARVVHGDAPPLAGAHSVRRATPSRRLPIDGPADSRRDPESPRGDA